MINLSINTRDFRELGNRHTAQKITQPFNDIETLYELVAEGLFDENVPDNEDQDTDSSSRAFDLFSLVPNYKGIIPFPHGIQHFSLYQHRIPSVLAEPTGPPPKQA